MSGAPSGKWIENYPNCKGSGKASIDSTTAHSGKNSLRIDGANGYCNHVFVQSTTDLTTIGSTIYVRLYMKHTTLLPEGHVAFIAMHDNTDNKDVRIGGQNKALQWNRELSDATLPEQSPQGVATSVPLPTGKWVCLEFMIDSSGKAQTWLDGKEVVGLHASGKWSGWAPKIKDLRLGWESYSGNDNTLWYDDVAIGSKRINC
jgi:hypothetical protein